MKRKSDWYFDNYIKNQIESWIKIFGKFLLIIICSSRFVNFLRKKFIQGYFFNFHKNLCWYLHLTHFIAISIKVDLSKKWVSINSIKSMNRFNLLVRYVSCQESRSFLNWRWTTIKYFYKQHNNDIEISIKKNHFSKQALLVYLIYIYYIDKN